MKSPMVTGSYYGAAGEQQRECIHPLGLSKEVDHILKQCKTLIGAVEPAGEPTELPGGWQFLAVEVVAIYRIHGSKCQSRPFALVNFPC